MCSLGKSYVTRVHQLSWREPTVEPWSLHLCLASPRWSTSWVWLNISLASCLKKTNKKHILSAFPSHNASYQLREDSSHSKRNIQWVRAWPIITFCFLMCCVECEKSLGGSLCLPSCLWWHTTIQQACWASSLEMKPQISVKVLKEYCFIITAF